MEKYESKFEEGFVSKKISDSVLAAFKGKDYSTSLEEDDLNYIFEDVVDEIKDGVQLALMKWTNGDKRTVLDFTERLILRLE